MKKLPQAGVRSLSWRDGALIDWVGGGRVLHLDGSEEPANVRYAFRFDAVATSPCGRYAVIYEKLGTKGLVLLDGRVLREINRSFYHANAYEYPITLFQCKSGEVVLTHCPEDYCQLELEEVVTGLRKPEQEERHSPDFFHSRLRVSRDGQWLLSGGWVWHPWGLVSVFNLTAALGDSSVLDRPISLPDIDGEISSAEFLSDNLMLLATSLESLDGDEAPVNAVGTMCSVGTAYNNRFNRTLDPRRELLRQFPPRLQCRLSGR